jgi:hypothetical protein
MDDIQELIDGKGIIETQKIYHISGSQLSELMLTWKKAGNVEASMMSKILRYNGLTDMDSNFNNGYGRIEMM